MKINTLFKRNKAVFSFEVFPPKKDSPIESVYGKLEEICALKPDFVSVTYGAGGSGAHSRTCEIAAKIKHDFGVESVAHLTCVNSTRAMIDETLEDFRQNGIENILALRGDYAEGVPPQKDFRYASELCAYIRAHGYRFLERTKIAGIGVPIEAGIMPVTNKRQIERMVSLCGASLPPKFVKIMQRYESKPEALRDAGIAYAVEQIVDLLANGVDGIHLYTMNNPTVAKKITRAVETLL